MGLRRRRIVTVGRGGGPILLAAMISFVCIDTIESSLDHVLSFSKLSTCTAR